MRDTGFGREVRQALARRRQWLIEQQLARQEEDRVVYRANMLGLLRRRELTRVAGQLSGELSLNYVEGHSDQRIEGVYRRHNDLASGRLVLIEKSREFTLVPSSPVLERHYGTKVHGIACGQDDSRWFGGKTRGTGHFLARSQPN